MKTILVTGGCGFIGSCFVRMVMSRTEWRIVNLDALTYAGDPERLECLHEGDRYRFVRGDISDRRTVWALLHEEMPWAVVNFAAESHVDRSIVDASPFVRTNVVGVQVLLDAARAHHVARFLQVSTDEVYGDLAGEAPASEGSHLQPSSPYAASKAAADLMCLAYRRTHGVPLLIVRSSNNYGPWQFPEKFVPLIIRNALAGNVLPIYGDGKQRRDWLFVEDNCDAILCVLERGEIGSVYNVATGEERTNFETVGILCRLLADEGHLSRCALESSRRLVQDRPGHDRRYAMDASKICRELGWSPGLRYEDGLRSTVRWYLDHEKWLVRAGSGEHHKDYTAIYSRR